MNPPAWFRRLPPAPVAGPIVLLMALLLLGRMTGWYDFYGYLGLDPSAVWRGEVWRLFTYPLLPMGPIDFLMGGWAFLWFCAWLDRVWKPLECWLYVGLCAVAAGLAACLLFPRAEGLLGGATIAVAGLLVAWGRLCGHERLLAAPGLELSGRTAALAWGAVLLIVTWFSCGRWFVLPMLAAGAGAGWLYLTARWHWIHRQTARLAGSERMSRLEL